VGVVGAGDCGVRRGTASLSAWPGRSATDRPPRMPLVSPFKNGHAPKADLISGAHGGRRSGSRGPGSGRARRARMAAVEICFSPSTGVARRAARHPPGTCAGWPRLSRIRCTWVAWSGQAQQGPERPVTGQYATLTRPTSFLRLPERTCRGWSATGRLRVGYGSAQPGWASTGGRPALPCVRVIVTGRLDDPHT
jgi:hypothetical protein